MKNPLLVLASCFALGILVVRGLPSAYSHVGILLVITTALVIIGAVLARANRTYATTKPHRAIAVAA